MVSFFKKTSESAWFNNFIVLVILAAGVLVGVETYRHMEESYGPILHLLNDIILWIFVAEVVVKLGAEWPKPQNYFKDSWNVFDFAIVAVCFLPVNASFVAVLRLARILRVLKLVTALPRLQMIVGALLKSIPSMGYVFLLLILHFYIFATMATFFYSENDPIHFADLQTSMLSLFRAVTLEDWTDLMYINMHGSDAYGYGEAELARIAEMGVPYQPSASPIGAAMYFVAFILTGAMIILNLFIGVIMKGMDEMNEEAELEKRAKQRDRDNVDIIQEVAHLDKQIEDLRHNLLVLNERLKAAKQQALEPKEVIEQAPEVLEN